MSKSLRLSEKWFNRGLWLVALIFAGFLIGLGRTLIGDLPKVEQTLTLEDFVDKSAAASAQRDIGTAQRKQREAKDALDQAQLKHRIAQANSRSASESLGNWLATRHATERSDQDPELLSRTRALDELKAAERKALSDVQAQQQALLDARQAEEQAQARSRDLHQAAAKQFESALRSQQLRVFLYRLLLTLPLLVAAGLLFAKKRKTTYWPFVWGFIIFALFAFFVELVPYLPSYGGYVRYSVGIILTIIAGRQAVIAYNRYRERQNLEEQRPDEERREELSYDVALARLAKNACPGCERIVDLKDPANDFCPHCGIALHDHCRTCDARKDAFARFCHRCGTAAGFGKKTPA